MFNRQPHWQPLSSLPPAYSPPPTPLAHPASFAQTWSCEEAMAGRRQLTQPSVHCRALGQLDVLGVPFLLSDSPSFLAALLNKTTAACCLTKHARRAWLCRVQKTLWTTKSTHNEPILPLYYVRQAVGCCINPRQTDSCTCMQRSCHECPPTCASPSSVIPRQWSRFSDLNMWRSKPAP